MKTLVEIYHLIHALRDWPTPTVPFDQVAALIALHHAGEVGLRPLALSRVLGRETSAVHPTVAPLVKSGLVTVEASGTGSGRSYYVITAAGNLHAAKLFLEPSPALSR